jgi:hypothetical protein
VLEPAYCDGFARPAVRSGAYCLVPMAVLRSSAFGLVRGDPIAAQVRAHNAYGYGGLSPANSAGPTVQTAPGQVVGLVEGPATTESQVELVWAALTTPEETGGSPVLSYNAQWDLGSGGLYENLVGYVSDFAATGFTVTSGIRAGAPIRFRVRAKNMWGWGPYSGVLLATPSAVPEQMEPPTTAIEPVAGAVVVSWTAPPDNAARITAYSIEALDAAGSVWSEVPGDACDGSREALVAARSCTVPMAAFTAPPFGLLQGALIRVRAAAFNVRGWGLPSAPSSGGAAVRTPPTYMAAPARDPSSSDSQIVLVWSPLSSTADTGGAAILSYGLEWDAGSGGGSWAPLSGFTVRTLATTFTITTGLTPGAGYLFRLSAENVYGWGPTSAETTVYAAGLPAQPAQALLTNDGTDVVIAWAAPANSAAPIEAYAVYLRLPDGSYREESTHCDGTDPSIVAALSCRVPLTALRSGYGLVYGDLVQARVRARNANGWGSLS